MKRIAIIILLFLVTCKISAQHKLIGITILVLLSAGSNPENIFPIPFDKPTLKVQNMPIQLSSPFISHKELMIYPNPFNSTTLIKYELPNEDFVSIKLYDLLGREIYTLVNSYQKAGAYVITLNVVDLGLSTGVYLYRFSTKNFSTTKKMIYLK